MSRKTMRRGAIAVAAMALALPAGAGAHNAGHFTLPDGSCHEVGSFRHAPLVGPKDDRHPLDLMPETPSPFDEYGASFAAFRGSTPILPGPCR
ncbi:MAG TPA: hypothetical protein VH620_05685 [Gaiella sp.]